MTFEELNQRIDDIEYQILLEGERIDLIYDFYPDGFSFVSMQQNAKELKDYLQVLDLEQKQWDLRKQIILNRQKYVSSLRSYLKSNHKDHLAEQVAALGEELKVIKEAFEAQLIELKDANEKIKNYPEDVALFDINRRDCTSALFDMLDLIQNFFYKYEFILQTAEETSQKLRAENAAKKGNE